ncbi:MAG TPA: phosphate acetyltransferase [Oceanospirillales bacterium]|jgi:phosphate acetyltransferase|nr:phosphate acetyltransferase [Oleispira sp.]HCM06622.1 phosphate acetyltransferase [Oceanospirillales bacterium]|tara:strand:- start:1204 stop:3312 length:2109 start_codon:yes stop_codon:yes gene_type:complete
MINIFIAPTGLHSGLSSISIALLHALDTQGIKASFFKPVAPYNEGEVERSTQMVKQNYPLNPPQPMPLKQAQQLISTGQQDRLLEDLVGMHHIATRGTDVTIVEGLVPDRSEPYTAKINAEIAKALNADVILISSAENRSNSDIQADINLNAAIFGGFKSGNIIGAIINKFGTPVESHFMQSNGDENDAQRIEKLPKIEINNCRLLGTIPWQRNLISPRTLDISRQLHADVINEGDLATRRINTITLCARTLPNILNRLTAGTLIVTPGDRVDIILACALAETNGTPLAGLILTGGLQPKDDVLRLCQKAINNGLPILSTESDTFACASQLNRINSAVPEDDLQRIDLIRAHITDHIDIQALLSAINAPHAVRLSPAAFRFQLVERSRANIKRIVLPEGEEPRTIQAAVTCQQRGIAQCILLGKKDAILQVAEAQGIELPSTLEILDPDDIRESYVPSMVELRKHKNLTAPMASAQLEDNVVLGTMMLALDHVDGLVSGAIHTTANTIRPAMQLIKTAPGAKLISSVFYMCLPEQVLVYGDCAVNPDPNAEELADIAIQSADSALAMGIEPKVAMISYSTGVSGSGSDVEKVKQATAIAKELRPDLIIDGPLQYDAATTESVAKSKAPDSPVAGKATVLVFPDLNTGNTTYKAVQRSANVISVGPMLQGLRKPVNDLSRGALVEDIVYTIALTSIQAQQLKS